MQRDVSISPYMDRSSFDDYEKKNENGWDSGLGLMSSLDQGLPVLKKNYRSQVRL